MFGGRTAPTGKPQTNTTWSPDCTIFDCIKAESTSPSICSSEFANGTRCGFMPHKKASRRQVSSMGVNATIGTHGRIFEMSQAVWPCIVKQAIAFTFLSFARVCAARAIETASLALNSSDMDAALPHSTNDSPPRARCGPSFEPPQPDIFLMLILQTTSPHRSRQRWHSPHPRLRRAWEADCWSSTPTFASR